MPFLWNTPPIMRSASSLSSKVRGVPNSIASPISSDDSILYALLRKYALSSAPHLGAYQDQNFDLAFKTRFMPESTISPALSITSCRSSSPTDSGAALWIAEAMAFWSL